MKAICLASAATIVLLAAATVVFRAAPTPHRVRRSNQAESRPGPQPISAIKPSGPTCCASLSARAARLGGMAEFCRAKSAAMRA